MNARPTPPQRSSETKKQPENGGLRLPPLRPRGGGDKFSDGLKGRLKNRPQQPFQKRHPRPRPAKTDIPYFSVKI
ncbi:hypothetical protein, partial [Neisseria bacilliformis]|uniref:hypothetical protein n=1 Tax=Neisseria bacilliformis TaxID=267212 RepID=UPI003C737E4D